jgi:hypothetical protein
MMMMMTRMMTNEEIMIILPYKCHDHKDIPPWLFPHNHNESDDSQRVTWRHQIDHAVLLIHYIGSLVTLYDEMTTIITDVPMNAH